MMTSRLPLAAFLLVFIAPATAQTTVPASSADLFLDGSVANARFGGHVASAGDVNGDGYDDVLIGDASYVYLHLGSATGLSPTAAWVLGPGQFWGGYCAGDVNGDGFDDVMVGDPFFDSNRGRALIFMGSAAASPLPAQPSWIIEGPAGGAQFGIGLNRGDFNGDGFSDVAVVAASVQVFEGSASGLNVTPSWVLSSPGFPTVGFNDAAVEDVNGDGFSDLALTQFKRGDKWYPGSVDSGQLLVFKGSAAGLGAKPTTTIQIDLKKGTLPPTVAPAGNTGGDGYGDLAVSMLGGIGPVFEPGTSEPESVFLYHGTKTSVKQRPDTILSGLPNDTLVVGYVGGGDLNGDGYSDLIVPKYFSTVAGSFVPYHALWIFEGGVQGLGSTPSRIILESANDQFPLTGAFAGDLNGDGFGDLIAGGPAFSGAASGAGRVYIFYGKPSF